MRRKRLLLVLPPVFVVLVIGAVVGGRHLWATSHYRAAVDAEKRHDFDAALSHLDRCLQIRPNDAANHLAAARVARRAGNFVRAEQSLAEYERRAGHTPDLTRERAALQVQRGEGEPSQENYLWAQIEAGDTDSVPLLEALAQACLQSYRLAGAMTCLEKLLALDPDNDAALVWRASVWEGVLKFPNALVDYRRAVELRPGNDAVRCRLADLLLFLSKTEEAAVEYDRVREHRPDDPAALLGLAHANRRQNNIDAARRHLDALLTVRPDDPAGLRERGLLAMDAGAYADAEASLRKAERADPFDQEICYNLGQCLEKLDRPAEAKPFFERAEALDRDSQELRALAVQIGKKPDDAGLRYQAGAICLRNGQKGEALRWWGGALQIDPLHRETHAALAAYYARHGQQKLAEEHGRFVRANPSAP